MEEAEEEGSKPFSDFVPGFEEEDESTALETIKAPETGFNSETTTDEKQIMDHKRTEKSSERNSDVKLVDSHFFSDFELVPFHKREYSLSPSPRSDEDEEYEDSPPVGQNDRNKILDGDHPLLERFQRSLRNQLLQKIEFLKADVADLDSDCKNANSEKEVLGIEAYETQQVINKQQDTIEMVLRDLDNVAGALEEMDYRVQKTSEEHKILKNELHEVERSEIQLRTELESMDTLVQHMKKWEEEVESELLINQRMLDKTIKNKEKATEEKRQQDLIIYKLMSETWKLEGELETLLMQMRVKEADRERLAEAAALANIDIEAAQSEHRCLIHGWNSVLVTITRRDKYYNHLMQEFQKFEDKLSSTNCEIYHLKKQVQREHQQNENLMLLRDRIDLNLKQTHRVVNAELEKRNHLLRMMADNENFLEQITKDLDATKNKILMERNGQALVFKEIDELNLLRHQHEQQVLQNVQERSFTNYAGDQILHQISDLKEKNRTLRINIARMEFCISQKLAELQSYKMDDVELTKTLDDAAKQLQLEDGELDAINKEYDHCEKTLRRTIKTFEILKDSVPKEGDKDMKELTAQEVKIKQLEATISDITEKNKQSQNFWLREQAIVVDLSERRQSQMNDINMLKKQITILDQKNLKITDELETYAKQEEDINRSINVLQNKMQLLTANLNKKKDCKEQLNIYNNKTAQQLTAKLEECEFESIKLKAEIKEIEEDKYILSNELIDKNREFLGWEKKLIMVMEARKTLMENKTEDSEIGQMRGEIHRMNVRYIQLKRAQEKLLSDLDNCVSRRDAIVTLAEAKTRVVKGSTQKWRINFNKKIDDCKNKLSQLQREIETVEHKIENRTKELENIQTNMENMQEVIEDNRKTMKQVQTAIDSCQINKQLNLDILLFKQRKLKVYAELAKGRSPFMYFKTTSAAHNAYVRERELNSKLRTVIEDLQCDFPQHDHFLTKTHNSLVVPALNL